MWIELEKIRLYSRGAHLVLGSVKEFSNMQVNFLPDAVTSFSSFSIFLHMLIITSPNLPTNGFRIAGYVTVFMHCTAKLIFFINWQLIEIISLAPSQPPGTPLMPALSTPVTSFTKISHRFLTGKLCRLWNQLRIFIGLFLGRRL